MKINHVPIVPSDLDVYIVSYSNLSITPKQRLISLPNDKILDWSKLKEFADINFEIDENSRKFFKRLENTVGRGEFARYEQFLLFPLRFQKTCIADTRACLVKG